MSAKQPSAIVTLLIRISGFVAYLAWRIVNRHRIMRRARADAVDSITFGFIGEGDSPEPEQNRMFRRLVKIAKHDALKERRYQFMHRRNP